MTHIFIAVEFAHRDPSIIFQQHSVQ